MVGESEDQENDGDGKSGSIVDGENAASSEDSQGNDAPDNTGSAAGQNGQDNPSKPTPDDAIAEGARRLQKDSNDDDDGQEDPNDPIGETGAGGRGASSNSGVAADVANPIGGALDQTVPVAPKVEDFLELSPAERYSYIMSIHRHFANGVEELVKSVNSTSVLFKSYEKKARWWKNFLIVFGSLLAIVNAAAALELASIDLDVNNDGDVDTSVSVILSSFAAIFAIVVAGLSSVSGVLDYPARATQTYSRHHARLAIVRRYEARWLRYVDAHIVADQDATPQGCLNASLIYAEFVEARIEESRNSNNEDESE